MKFDLRLLEKKEFLLSHKNEEWFDIYDKHRQKIGKAPRSVCHGRTFLLHRVVHLLVFNSLGQILLQKRQMSKKIQPGKWDTSVGGHIATEETTQLALQRESIEELGLDIKACKIKFLYDYIMISNIEKEWVFTFFTKWDGPFHHQVEEISELRFWDFDEIRDKRESGIFTPNFLDEFDRFTKIKI